MDLRIWKIASVTAGQKGRDCWHWTQAAAIALKGLVFIPQVTDGRERQSVNFSSSAKRQDQIWGGGLLLFGASLVAQRLKHLPAMWETRVRSLVWEDALEKEMATHSSTLAWRIPWREEPGGLQSTGSQRVGYDWATSLHFTYCCLDHLNENGERKSRMKAKKIKKLLHLSKWMVAWKWWLLDVPGGPVVKNCLPVQGIQVRSLFRELRSHRLQVN